MKNPSKSTPRATQLPPLRKEKFKFAQQQPNPNLNPIILIPGVVGSKLITKSTANPDIWEYAWVPQSLSIKKIWRSIVQNFWGLYQNGRYYSFQELYNYASTVPVQGLNGCYRILDSGLTDWSLAPILHLCYYFDYYIENLRALGYVFGVNLFAFSFDWRQSPSSSIIQSELKSLIELARNQNNNKKVSIIAHSMGGLVTQAYMAQNPDTWHNDIRRFVALTVPFDGSCGFSSSSYFEGFAMGFPLLNNVGRGFQGKCPGITSLTPHDFESYEGEYAELRNSCLPCVFSEFEPPVSALGPGQQFSSFYSVRQSGHCIIFENPESDLEKIILDYSVYKNAVPDVAFVILRHILQNNLVQHDLVNVVLTLQKACLRGAVVTSQSFGRGCRSARFQVYKTQLNKAPDDGFQFGDYNFAEFEREMADLRENGDAYRMYAEQFDTQGESRFQVDRPQFKADDIDCGQFTRYYFSTRRRNRFLELNRVILPLDVQQFFDSGGFMRPVTCASNFALKCAMYNQMREEFIALQGIQITADAHIRELLKQQFVPGTLEHVLFQFDQRMTDSCIQTVHYPDDCDYKFMSFCGSGVKTTFHCFRRGNRSKYTYADGDGLVLLTSALSDCTPPKYVESRVVLPKITHMKIKFQQDVFQKVFVFINGGK